LKFLALLLIGFVSISFGIQNSFSQIEQVPLDLEQLAISGECTKKFIGGESGVTPLTLKVFYDITTNRKLEYTQMGSSFPITQQTNQVMVFYTNGTDQYQIYMEMNYNQTKDRMIYIETQSAGITTSTWQEKFNTNKYCMTIFANTKEPVRPLTKEDIFGDTLNAINQVPAIITALNLNTNSNSANQTVQWFIITVQFVLMIFFVLYTMTLLKGGKIKKFEQEYESWFENKKDDVEKRFEKVFALGDINKKIDLLHNDVMEIKKNISSQPKSFHEEMESEETFVQKIRGAKRRQLGFWYEKLLHSNSPESRKRLQLIKNEARKQKVKTDSGVPVSIDMEPRPVTESSDRAEESIQEQVEIPDKPIIPQEIITPEPVIESTQEELDEYEKQLTNRIPEHLEKFEWNPEETNSENMQNKQESVSDNQPDNVEPIGEDAGIIKDVLKSMDIETGEAIFDSWTNDSLEKAWSWLTTNFVETEENRAYVSILETELKRRGILT